MLPISFPLRADPFSEGHFCAARHTGNHKSCFNFNPFSPADQYNVSANSVDPNETAQTELCHQNLYCSSFCFEFGLSPLFGTMGLTRFRDWSIRDEKIIMALNLPCVSSPL